MPNQQNSKPSTLPEGLGYHRKGLEDESTLYTLGTEFLEATRVLRVSTPTRLGYQSVIYYLLGHAAELFLKTYLHTKGMSIRSLMDMKHNLASLINETRRHGLSNQSKLVCVHALSPLYASKALEYRDQSTKCYPLLEDLFVEVEQLSMLAFPNRLFQPYDLSK